MPEIPMSEQPKVSSPALIKSQSMSSLITAQPIIDNPQLKPMASAGAQPVVTPIGGKQVFMASQATPVSGPNLMSPLPNDLAAASGKPNSEQKPIKTNGVAESPKSVRLRLRITDGQVRVVGVRVVEGVLPTPERLDYGLAYEISSGQRRIAWGSVPDVGTQRSYPDPQGRAGMQGHHLEELPSVEVNVSLPQRDFNAATLPQLRIQFFRMKGQPPAAPITSLPLAEQFADHIRPVAELRGIDVGSMGPDLVNAFSRAFIAPK